MNAPGQDPAYPALQQARKALSEKRSAAARQWAMEAARLNPNLEEPWLILGGLGTPSESVAYLQHALSINPRSSRARAGLEWALRRLQQSGPDHDEVTGPVIVPPAAPADVTAQIPVAPTDAGVTAQIVAAPFTADDTARLRAIGAAPKTRRIPLLAWVILTLLVCMGITAVVMIPLTGILLAQANSSEHPLSLQKATNVTTDERTDVATDGGADGGADGVVGTQIVAPTQTPVPTQAPSLSQTPAPTQTVVPTETPTATETTAPTQTQVIGPGGVPVVEITPISPYQPAQVYIPPGPSVPGPGAYPTAVVYEPQVSVTSGEHWVDVNLSNQTAAAYDGDQLVRSFVVSTGTSEHPTVTGQYSVYVKYRYADMAGPGYYLPDVPYVMYFYSGYGLHGTYWHSNFGTPMSHGCVNFSIDDAAWLFDFVSVGTTVNVHY